MQAVGQLAIPPRPASRPRFTCRGRFAVAYTDKPYRDWLDRAVELLKWVPVPDGWDPERQLCLEIAFFVQKPKTSKLEYPKPDIDNYAKAFMDAVTQSGRFWGDDSQVVHLVTSKQFSEIEGIEFTLTPV